MWERLQAVNNQFQKRQSGRGAQALVQIPKKARPADSALPVIGSTGEAIALSFIRKISGTQARSSLQQGLWCGQTFKQQIYLQQQEPNGGQGSSYTAWGIWRVPILPTRKALDSLTSSSLNFPLICSLIFNYVQLC